MFAVALVTYALTLAPSIFLVDSAPLTVAAWGLGNAHPPGFPLFLMLTHLAAHLPFGDVAVRTNAASALFAALACAMVTLAVGELAPRKRLAMLLGGLLLASSRTLWAYATITEVYALNTFLIATLWWLVLRWRRTGEARLLNLAAVVFGLALGVHHVTAGLSLLGLLPILIAARRSLVVAVLISIATAGAVYAYLPVAAAREPVLNWGNPSDARSFVEHVTAKSYRHFVRTEAVSEQIGQVVRLGRREIGVIGLVLGLMGLTAIIRADRRLFLAFMLTIAATVAWVAVYPIADDEDAYLLPAFVVVALGAAYGGSWIAGDRRVVAAALLAVPVLNAYVSWPERDRSDHQVARDYGTNALRGIDRDSVLVTADRHLWGSLLYLTEVEQLRRDVTVVMYPLLIRSWYVEDLARREPAVGRELLAYRPLLNVYENETKRWREDAAVRDEFQRRLDDLVVALVARRVERGGHVYATPDVVFSEQEIDRGLVTRLRQGYDVVPGGLAMELLPGRKIRQIRIVPLELRGLAGATDPTVIRDIVPAYVTALRLRARYLQATGSPQPAAESSRLADGLAVSFGKR